MKFVISWIIFSIHYYVMKSIKQLNICHIILEFRFVVNFIFWHIALVESMQLFN